jgi:hypothetical protein
MDVYAIGNSLELALRTQLPRILGAIAFLIVGWIVAILVRAAIRRVLGAAHLNRHIASTTEQKLDLESGIAAAAFWLVILVTLIGVFNALDLALASGPFEVMVKEVAVYLPHLVAGTVLLLIAWIAAVALRGIVNRVLDSSGLDEKLSATAGMRPDARERRATCSIGWFSCLFLPAILDAYNLGGLLDPVRVMVAKALRLSAQRVRRVRHRLRRLAARQRCSPGSHEYPRRCGRRSRRAAPGPRPQAADLADRRHPRADLVFVPALIAALDVLSLEAISRPADDMLGKFLAAVPNIVAAALILGVTYYVAKFRRRAARALAGGRRVRLATRAARACERLHRRNAAVAARGADRADRCDAVRNHGSGQSAANSPRFATWCALFIRFGGQRAFSAPSSSSSGPGWPT